MPPVQKPAIQTERLRDYRGPVTNSAAWDGLALRPDDIIVTTPPKCGTTWMLNIVMMLIHGKVVADAGNRVDAPWFDAGFRDSAPIAAFLDGLQRRRCLKSHTPLDGISYGAEPTYIVVYRHPVDVHFSMRDHAANMKADLFPELFPDDISAGFARFVEAPATDKGTDDLTIASIAHHYAQARARARGGNVHFFHYADLSRDLVGQIKRLATIMGIALDPDLAQALTEANSFAAMRKVAEDDPERFAKHALYHDPADFFASGSSHKWQGRLNAEALERYDARCAALLDPKDVAWLNWGARGRPD